MAPTSASRTGWSDGTNGSGPDKEWTAEKIQITQAQQPTCYGGFIHSYSSSEPEDLHLLVSRWERDISYDVTQWVASV